MNMLIAKVKNLMQEKKYEKVEGNCLKAKDMIEKWKVSKEVYEELGKVHSKIVRILNRYDVRKLGDYL